MRISDWSSDVCSSDLLTIGTKTGTISANKIGHNRLDGLSVSAGTRDYGVGGNYFRNNTTRNHGIVGANLAWSETDWTRLTGQVSGRNGTQNGRAARREKCVRTCRSRGSADPEK